jgi:hypothetical protein
MTRQRKSTKLELLQQIVLEKSKAQGWELACTEWEVTKLYVDEGCRGTCRCSQDRLKYLYTIKNKETGHELYPVGSVCIKHFKNDEMTARMNLLEKVDRMGNYKMRAGTHKGTLFKNIRQGYIDFLKGLHFKKACYKQLLEYDELRAATMTE